MLREREALKEQRKVMAIEAKKQRDKIVRVRPDCYFRISATCIQWL